MGSYKTQQEALDIRGKAKQYKDNGTFSEWFDSSIKSQFEENKKRGRPPTINKNAGVYYRAKNHIWVAEIKVKSILYYLGSYYTLEQALGMRLRAEEHRDKGDFVIWYKELFPNFKVGYNDAEITQIKPVENPRKLTDLTDKIFNFLSVVSSAGSSKNGHVWNCKCLLCGKPTTATTKELKSGGKKSCGCLKNKTKDITNQPFGRLTAIKPVGKKNGQTIWQCRCSCPEQNEVEVPISSLTSGNTQSCGCLSKDTPKRKEANAKHNVNGTRIPALGNKPPASNSSGIRGVSWNRQKEKWEAYIKFQGTQYRLGFFDELEDAGKARKTAEEQLFGNFIEWYNRQSEQKKKGDTNQ